jgi:hypothetical protein
LSRADALKSFVVARFLRLRTLECAIYLSMNDQHEAERGQKTATQTLADLVAKRKAQGSAAWTAALRKGDRQSERAAAARSASKSKPMLRK